MMTKLARNARRDREAVSVNHERKGFETAYRVLGGFTPRQQSVSPFGSRMIHCFGDQPPAADDSARPKKML
jgi:hypothetical protein